MMGALAEYLRSEMESLKRQASSRKEALAEWLASLNALYTKLAGWILDADGGMNVICTHTEYPVLVSEPRLGDYWFRKLTIDLTGRRATVEPRARYVVASIQPPGRDGRRADGMVQLLSEGTTEYYLFRWKQPDGDEWFLCNVHAWGQDSGYGKVEPLTQEAFEAAVLRALQ